MKRFTAFAMGLLALTIVGTAFAGGGSTVVSGYGGKAGGPVGAVVTSHPGKVHTGTTLPFTGLNLVGIAAVALLLVALGYGMTRMARKRETS